MKNLTLILCVALCSLASYVRGGTVTPADYVGSRTVGDGINGVFSWGSPSGLSIEWTITHPNDVYYYSFYFSVPSNAPDFILFEIGQNADSTIYNIHLDGFGRPTPAAATYGPGDFLGLPSDIYGLKLDFFEDRLNWHVYFESYREPIWGDFFSQDGSLIYAYNSGFGSEPTSRNFIPWIPVPGAVPVPEPSTYLLLASFLLFFVVNNAINTRNKHGFSIQFRADPYKS
ncbi:MAG: hypothetical protein Q8K75_00475 [Chlamydiales bacterium]|nr:hypothetical protein [Chlamydiales bacterium]